MIEKIKNTLHEVGKKYKSVFVVFFISQIVTRIENKFIKDLYVETLKILSREYKY